MLKAWRGMGSRPRIILICLLLAAVLISCSAPQVQQGQISITIRVDGSERSVKAPAGSTVQAVLQLAGVTLNPIDRSEPPLYTLLTDGSKVRIIRVREEFTVEHVTIPYTHQEVKNESIPERESRLVQPGANGEQEITYRHMYEDDVEISSSPVKTMILKDAVPEIMMVGSQTPFTSFDLPGRLAYLLAGNAWLIEGSTGNRRPLVTTGDLDGRIFSLSPDSRWLLYSRRSTKDGQINTLWAMRIDSDAGQEPLVVDLQATNVIHFAEWRPGSLDATASYIIAYSTVEPRSSAPGWQANNDLNLVALSSSGYVRQMPPILETNMGGNYGWWGMNFAWSPDGSMMAYARPDGVGSLEIDKGELIPALVMPSLQTGADWAWVPGISWGADGKVIFTVQHNAPAGSVAPEQSQDFDLAALPLATGAPIRLVSKAGMFSYPLTSPIQPQMGGESGYQVAYLQAITPDQSEGSRYRLMLIDRDGSNLQALFPQEGAPGFEPQEHWGAWSPQALPGSQHYAMAVIYQKNLWLVDASTGAAQQITGDDLVTRVAWGELN